jgi:hypothetical protein
VASAESPAAACRREAVDELGLDRLPHRLTAVDLSDADLTDTDLTDTDLTGTRGLLARQLSAMQCAAARVRAK